MNNELYDRIRALRFYDIGALAREVKGESLGIDINRAFSGYRGQPGGTKGGFARWVLANLDNELVEAGLPPYEKEASNYYAGRKSKGTGEVTRTKTATELDEEREDAVTAARKSLADDKAHAPAPAAPAAPALGGLDAMFSSMIAESVKQAMTEGARMDAEQYASIMEQVDVKIIHELATVKPLVITVSRPEGNTTTTMARQHKQFSNLLKLAGMRKAAGGFNIWLTGPAGSGKTTAASNTAKALDLPFYFTGAIADEFKLLGYMDATGNYSRTPFREAYENGGIFLMDECDGSSAQAILALNAALANGNCDFADGNIPRHKDCVIIAAANTWGNGATREYIGRTEIDAATLDRFIMVAWEYDEDLERETCGDATWAELVQQYRKAVGMANVQHMITPRASYDGAAMLAEGFTKGDVIDMMLRRGMPDAQWATVERYT